MNHEHEWGSWVYDAWCFQQSWRRDCMTRGCLGHEATLDITVAHPEIQIDEERDWLLPDGDGDIEYTEFGWRLVREHLKQGTPWDVLYGAGGSR